MTTKTDALANQTAPQMQGHLAKIPGASFFNNLRIGTKLTIGFSILVLLALLGVAFSYLGSIPATRNIERTSDVSAPIAISAANAQTNLLRMLGDVRGYLALGEGEFRQSYNQARQAFLADLADLKSKEDDLNPENRERLERLEAIFEEWSQWPEQLFALRDDQIAREPAYRILVTDGLRTSGNLLLDTQEIIRSLADAEPTRANTTLLTDLAEFQSSFASMVSALRGYVTTRNRDFKVEYRGNLTQNNLAWERIRSQARLLDENQQARFEEIARQREEFLTLPDRIFDELESEAWRQDLYLFSTEAVPRADEMNALLGNLTQNQTTTLTRDLGEGRHELEESNRRTLTVGLVSLLLGAVLSFILRQNITGPIRRLTGVAEQVRGGDLEAQAQVEARDEIGTLAETFNSMTGKLRQTLFQVSREKERADNLLDVVIPIGVELTAEQDFNRLLEKMLLEAKSFVHADAGVLYLVQEEGKSLEYVSLSNDTLGMAQGGTSGAKISFEPLPLYDADGAPNHDTIATHVALTAASLNVSNANLPEAPKFSGPKIFGKDNDYDVTSHLSIPLKNSNDQVLGVLQLINAEDPDTDVVTPFDENLQQMMESFSSLAVAALEAYIREQSLKQEIKQLKIEIDQAKRQREVQQIVDTEVFKDLQSRAKDLRTRRRRNRDRGKDKE